MTQNSHVRTQQEDGVLRITLDRPKANAFDREMVEDLMGVLAAAEREGAVRCVVLTGEGGFFSTGHDVGDIVQAGLDVPYRYHLERTYNRLILQMRGLGKPIVGAINGPAVGAGLGIALATDIRWAAESASFVFGFTGIGLTVDSGVSLMLPHFIGASRAMEMAVTNAPVPADEALTLGLVSKVVPDGDLKQVVQELAHSIAIGPTQAFSLTKRAFNRAVLSGMADVLAYEAILQEIAGRSDDHREGVTAFLEKRTPQFLGH